MITTEANSSLIPTVDKTPKSPNKIKAWMNNHLVETIGGAVLVSLVLLGISAGNIWTAYRGFKDSISKQFTLQELSDEIIYLDEVLTMSARMAASTGETAWIDRYNNHVDKLDQTINNLETLAPSFAEDTQQTGSANNELVRMEEESFALVITGEKDEALRLLMSQEYELQKEIYAGGVNNALDNIKSDMELQLNTYSNNLYRSLLFAGVSFPLLIISWVSIGLQVKAYIEEREQAQKSLQALNQDLEIKGQELAVAEKAKSEENEILQMDIEDILDVVSAVKEGDLTIEAKVNERATGLVADTLNRLIEELNRTLVQVFQVAQEVSNGSGELETLAVSTLERAQQQAESVQEVQNLMDNVTHLAQTTTAETQLANKTMQESSLVVAAGQEAMLAMTKQITALQEGREQIIKRSETLSDFVELTSQFVRDQQRVAALTRVLAFNASTIAQRATTDSDPEQLAVVVREFEIIANQINDLATETNQSLGVLQQRTDQLEIVASGFNEDVKDINQLVNNFIHEVNRSTDIFTTIKQVTEQLAQVEERVSQSSIKIADAAENTLMAVTDIAEASQETQNSALVTRNQSSNLEEMAQKLLERVKFFKLENEH